VDALLCMTPEFSAFDKLLLKLQQHPAGLQHQVPAPCFA
jgi:hypothetical protein